jgi:GNAT superfamily N-acetyltransferase
MFQVKPMCPPDYPYATELADTMSWNMTNEDFAFNCSLEPEGCLVLYEDSRRVGIATCVSYGKTGWFGNLIIDPESRRKGAGGFLVRSAVNYLHCRGVESIGLYAYPNLSGFYGDIGFVADECFSVLHAHAIPKILCEQVGEISNRDIEAIARFDNAYFGGDRKRLLYSIFVAGETGILGYVLVKVFGGMAEVGPLVCVPNRADVGLNLLKSALGKIAGFDVYLCLQKNQRALQEYLYSVGFREEFYLTRMFLSSKLSKNCIYIAESKERG